MRRLVLIAFGAIQLVLVARIAMDLGMVPSGGDVGSFVMSASSTLAAPMQVLADAVGIGTTGGGVDPVIITALIGWSVVEGIALMILARAG